MATYNYFIIPRIFGIFMLLIAFFNYAAVGFSFYTIISIIVGLLFLVWNSKDLKNDFDVFISSFSRGQKIILVVFYELLFVLLFYTSTLLFSPLFKHLDVLGAEINKQASLAPSPETASIVNQLINQVLTRYFLILLAFLIIGFVLYTSFRSLVWSIILDKKNNKQVILRFFKVNSIWWVLFLVIGLLLILVSKNEFIPYIGPLLIIAYAHFTTPLFYYVLTKNKVKDVFSTAFSVTTININKLIIPYCFAIVVFFIISYPFSTSLVAGLSIKTFQTISVIISIFYFTWLNNFMSKNYLLK